MTERGVAIIFCKILAPPMPPPLPSTPQYITILITKIGRAIIFCRILATPNAPPLLPTSQYLTILMTERGRHYHCRMLVPPMPPSPDAPILNNLNDRGGGALLLL